MESRLTALGVEGGGIKQKREQTHGYGQQCGDCGWRGVVGGGRGYGGINSSRKK